MADNDFYGDLSSSSEGSDIFNDTTESDISVSSSDSDDGRNGSEYEHLSAYEDDDVSDYPIEEQPLSLRALAKLRTRTRLVPAAPVSPPCLADISPPSLADISLRTLQNVSAPVDPQPAADQAVAGSSRDPQFQDAESPRKRFKAGDRFSLRSLPHVRYAAEEEPVDTDPVPVVTGRTGVRMASYVEGGETSASSSSDEDYLPPSDSEDPLPGFGRGTRVTGRRGPGRPPKARRGRGRVGRGEDVPQDVGHGYQADMEDVDDPADIAPVADPAAIAPVADPAAIAPIAPVAPGMYIYFFHSICIYQSLK